VVVQAGQLQLSTLPEERMPVCCGSATIGMLPSRVARSMTSSVDDHITVFSQNIRGKLLGVCGLNQVEGRRSTRKIFSGR